ncbi:hypothetical protein I79_010419 [Cricetulus griseus]|uniref:Uncharacterized protein n=1 Tax=Cricetulus griseus TaxID=10029 RepID=G3HIF8_CRIGR|nr:hypothetical protein I79_010419 [Cricetulus griseus]
MPRNKDGFSWVLQCCSVFLRIWGSIGSLDFWAEESMHVCDPHREKWSGGQKRRDVGFNAGASIYILVSTAS